MAMVRPAPSPHPFHMEARPSMQTRIQQTWSALVILCCAVVTTSASQKLTVVIVDRQTSVPNYSYAVPANLFVQSNAGADTVTTTGFVTPPRSVSSDVRGATFTLRLPDGRLVVVNCESKYAPKGDFINRRSCRMPLVNEIQAEFDGDKAKLQWPVSIDGKKMESETYKILAILPKP